jgi:hypothetical protein
MDTVPSNGKNETKTPPKHLSLEIEVEHAAIMQQLERILESRIFKSSQNCRNFLRYVVEHAYQGKRELLKERILGVEVFGREPEYDSSLDPVVRITAGEVRKRLAQYYQEPAHADEVRIDIPSGSYLPEFYGPADAPLAQMPTELPKKRQRYLWLLALLPILAVVLYLAKPFVFQSVADQFWNPVCNSSLPVILCLPDQPEPGGFAPNESASLSSTDDLSRLKSMLTLRDFMFSDSAPYSDAIALAKLTGFLQARGVIYEVRRPNELSLGNMRGRAVVFIGSFHNEWTRYLMQGMRFTYGFDSEGQGCVIKDSLNPSQIIGKIDFSSKYINLDKGFGIITRAWEPRSESYMVFVGGVERNSTLSSGELVSDSKYLKEALSTAPANWAKKNIQIVFETPIIQGDPGPPHVLATHFW